MLSRNPLILAPLALLALPLAGQSVKERSIGLERLARIDAEVRPVAAAVALADARSQLPSVQRNGWDAFLREAGDWQVLLDRRTGMPLNVMGQGLPTLPGRGNSLTAAAVHARLQGLDTGMIDARTAELRSRTGESVDPAGFTLANVAGLTRDFIRTHPALFPHLEGSQLVLNPARSGNFGEEGYLWFIDFDQVIGSIPVDGAHLVFRYNHGNLVQFGGDHWARVRPDAAVASLTPDQALRAAQDYAGGWDERFDHVLSAPSLKLVPAISFHDRDEFERGYQGTVGHSPYTHKLVYDITFSRDGQAGTWLVSLSAVDGTVLEMRDINDYGTVKGGVYPGSSTGKGTETNIALPFANYGAGLFTDAGGNFSGTTGATSLAGKYVKISDSCGAISKSASSTGVIDLSSSTGTDCTSAGGGAGDTHASRTGFYQVNQIKMKARSFLPSNSWVNAVLTVNMNLNQTCNAYWNGTTLNFFKSGGGCGNTGELPDVFLHEFGHGLDQNDSTSAQANGGAGEAYGDTTALTMGHHSCIGPGFLGSNCGGYGNACTSCTGVRDIDYTKHASATRWTAAKSASSCPAASSCVGPMGRECHCESQPLTQANWELAQSLVTKYGSGAGWYQFDRIWYASVVTTRTGFTKVTSTSANGCGTGDWYSVFLTVNDDDGNLTNGTPDAAQIYTAYNNHGVACATQNHTSTKTGATLATPTVSKSAASGNSTTLSWGAISGATSYTVLKNTLGCSYGFIKVGTATTTSLSDAATAVGNNYYVVQATAGGGRSQFSNCLTVTH